MIDSVEVIIRYDDGSVSGSCWHPVKKNGEPDEETYHRLDGPAYVINSMDGKVFYEEFWVNGLRCDDLETAAICAGLSRPMPESNPNRPVMIEGVWVFREINPHLIVMGRSRSGKSVITSQIFGQANRFLGQAVEAVEHD